MKRNLLVMLVLAGCSTTTLDLEEERQLVIKQLIDDPNQALVHKDLEGAILSVPDSGDVFIANGSIFKRTRSEEREHYEEEIKTVEYLSFQHLTEPEIHFMDDGRACYGTAQVKIDYTLTSDTTRQKREFVYSILFVGEKQQDRWVMKAFSQSDRASAEGER